MSTHACPYCDGCFAGRRGVAIHISLAHRPTRWCSSCAGYALEPAQEEQRETFGHTPLCAHWISRPGNEDDCICPEEAT